MRLQDNQHFSHQHILIPLKLNQAEIVYCKACQEQILEEYYHGCLKCQHWLHDRCLNFPRSLEHPSHPSHPLTLLPKPTYSSRAYSCNACGSAGNSFSMSCAHCEFDLHLHCASLPKSLIDHEQHPHELKLLFSIPSSSHHDHENSAVFACDICHSVMNQNHWLYHCVCVGCDFGLHLDCAIPKRCSKVEKEGGEGEDQFAAGNHGEREAAGMSGNANIHDEHRNPWETLTPQVEQIRMVSEAQDRLYAAQMKAKIEAKSRQAMLDLVDPPRRYDYYY